MQTVTQDSNAPMGVPVLFRGIPIKLVRSSDEHTCGHCIASKYEPKPGLLRGACHEMPWCAAGYYVYAVDPGQPTCSDPKEEPQLLTEDPDHGDGPPPASVHRPAHGGYPSGPAMPLASAGYDGRSGHAPALARTTDPQTSHDAAAKVGGGKLIELVLSVMGSNDKLHRLLHGDDGWTGKELASFTGRPLNSITPRLAPLRRAGLIHAVGKRDKQIVWKLGNGGA